LTGIKRSNAYETHEQLKANTSAQGDEAYGKVWGADGRGPMVDIGAERDTPAGKVAWKRAERMMANDGITPSSGRPPDIPDAQWDLVKSAAKARGIALPEEGQVTLREAHYFKLALDDLKQPGLNIGPGEGGLGYNEGRSIHGVQKRLLTKMDAASPEYGAARSQFADNKALEKASVLGQDHWTRDPAESRALLKDMTPGEQSIYRDQAFDRWAQKVENGPEDVGKAQSKSLNQQRLRTLFPDDASFAKFKEGLKHEATMHQTKVGVLSGSNTADKFADIAMDAGITLPDLLEASRNPVPLMLRSAKAVMAPRLRASAEKVAAERAKLLTAGADGSAVARQRALQKMQPGGSVPASSQLMSAVNGPSNSPPSAPPPQPPSSPPSGRVTPAHAAQMRALILKNLEQHPNPETP
jgi:hypothetical protein